jgi:hypothetical protein
MPAKQQSATLDPEANRYPLQIHTTLLLNSMTWALRTHPTVATHKTRQRATEPHRLTGTATDRPPIKNKSALLARGEASLLERNFLLFLAYLGAVSTYISPLLFFDRSV